MRTILLAFLLAACGRDPGPNQDTGTNGGGGQSWDLAMPPTDPCHYDKPVKLYACYNEGTLRAYVDTWCASIGYYNYTIGWFGDPCQPCDYAPCYSGVI